jgi:lipopolysaccharide cholinephosphotransferase
MLPIKIALPEGFLEEEVRCGYTVSVEMKKLWAVELDLLAEFDRVCRKHGLTYFADGGTLLGAVRHKGFIPWDDDIDVAMTREEYKKLVQIADREFQHPYFFQTPFSDPGLVMGGSRLRNSDTTLISDFEHQRPYKNKGIFIDIFILDNIPDGALRLKIFKLVLKCYWRLLRYAAYYDGYFKAGKKYPLKKVFIGKLAIALKRIFSIQGLSRGYTRLCSRYNDKNIRQIGDIESSRGKFIFSKTCYDRQGISYAPFEHIQIPIPSSSDKVLSTLYGDYMVMKNIPSIHKPLAFDAETPYSEYCERQTFLNC